MLSIKRSVLFNIREVATASLAIIATYIASVYLSPWYISPNLSSGVGQIGWPVAYWMKTWVGQYPSGTEISSFGIFSLTIDVVLFYLLINCVEFALEYIGRRSRRESNPLRLNERVSRITKRMTVLVLVLFLMYGVGYVLFTSLFGSGSAQAVVPINNQ